MTLDAEPVSPSYLVWVFESLGLIYSILLPLAAFVSFVFAVVIVVRGKGPMAAAALMLAVHAPLLLGVLAALQGAIESYSLIAYSRVAASQVAAGITSALVPPVVALILTIPSYAVATLGALIRSLQSDSASASPPSA